MKVNGFRRVARTALAATLGLMMLAVGSVVRAQDGAGDAYKIRFINNSGDTGNFCVFQKDPDIGVDGVMSLAWFVKRVPTNSTTMFNWNISHSFVYSQTGKLIPGVTFLTTQSVPGNLTSGNSIGFDLTDGTYTLNAAPTAYSPAKGSMLITEGPDIVRGEASVGIGMSGAGTFAVPAEPNQKLTFTPHPHYFVAFGNYKSGQILDVQSMVGTPEVTFRGNSRSVTVTLNPNNTWTVVQD